jgi:hypothetical protein
MNEKIKTNVSVPEKTTPESGQPKYIDDFLSSTTIEQKNAIVDQLKLPEAFKKQFDTENIMTVNWNPGYDEYIEFRLDLVEADQEKLKQALKSSYGQISTSIEQAQEDLKYLESLLSNSFQDEEYYGVVNEEKAKCVSQKDELTKKGKQKNNDVVYEFLDEETNFLTRELYRTTRGFLEFRIESLKYHINEKIKENK